MAVITTSGELGSNCLEISQQVAHKLGYAFVDKRMVDAIFQQYGLTKFEDLYSSAPSFLDLLNADNLLLVSMANEIVEAIAQRGNVVIMGRAGFAVLADYADVLHVHIEAPFAERAQRVMEGEELADLQAAQQRVNEDDRVHRVYVQRFYNMQWDDPSNFDLVFDTASLAKDTAVEQIVAAARDLERQAATPGAPTTANIAVDPVLADTVAQVMAYPPPGVPDSGAH